MTNESVPRVLRNLHGRLRDARIRRAFWRAVTSRGQRDHPRLGQDYLDVMEVRRIFGVAADHRIVNADELHDLDEIVANARFAPGALARLQRYLSDRREHLPNVSEPLSGRERNRLASILEDSSNVGRIAFVSPGTHMFYEPNSYRAIGRLIREGSITVYTFHCGTPGEQEALAERVGGRWHSNSNQMYVPEAILGGGARRVRTIVHEATHAVQDFNNFRLRQDQYEADAYIAGAVSYFRGSRGSESGGRSIYDSARGAARSVFRGDAVTVADYDSVRAAVCASSSYSGADGRFRSFGRERSGAADDELQSLIRMMELEELRRR